MVAQKQDQQMTENRIILRCACLAKVSSDNIADWRIRSDRKWWRQKKISIAIHRQVQILLQSAGRKGFLTVAGSIIFSVLK